MNRFKLITRNTKKQELKDGQKNKRQNSMDNADRKPLTLSRATQKIHLRYANMIKKNTMDRLTQCSKFPITCNIKVLTEVNMNDINMALYWSHY